MVNLVWLSVPDVVSPLLVLALDSSEGDEASLFVPVVWLSTLSAWPASELAVLFAGASDDAVESENVSADVDGSLVLEPAEESAGDDESMVVEPDVKESEDVEESPAVDPDEDVSADEDESPVVAAAGDGSDDEVVEPVSTEPELVEPSLDDPSEPLPSSGGAFSCGACGVADTLAL